MKAVFLSLLLLCGCATTDELASAPPDHVYRSDKAREAIADCLMNRLSAPDIVPQKSEAVGVTTVGFTGHGGLTRPGIYAFTLRDAPGGGSVIGARMIHGIAAPSFKTAESCF